MNPISEPERRTFAGLIRLKMDYIENAMFFGRRQAALLAEINREEGYNANINTFRVTIWRSRQWWRGEWVRRQQGWQAAAAAAQRAPEKSSQHQSMKSAQATPIKPRAPQVTPVQTARHDRAAPNLNVDMDQIFREKQPLLFVKGTQ